MSIETLKHELASLDSIKRSHIVAYLVSLQDQQDRSYKSSITKKIDDNDPANWATLEDLDRRLGFDESKAE
jgi:hypothetical protein